MGGSKPSSPTVIMPPKTQPEQFQTVVPEKSFKDLAEQMKRIETETGKIQEQRYDEVGTPSQIGARQAGIRMREAAAYLGSLPAAQLDTSFKPTFRPFDIKSTASAASTVPGQSAFKNPKSASTTTQPQRKSQLDILKDAAKDNLVNAKNEYNAALKLAASKGRPKPTITKDPSFAKQDPMDYLPRKYNPETGKMEIV